MVRSSVPRVGPVRRGGGGTLCLKRVGVVSFEGGTWKIVEASCGGLK